MTLEVNRRDEVCELRLNAPPENMVKRPKTVPSICWKKLRTTSGSIPGVTMKAPTR